MNATNSKRIRIPNEFTEILIKDAFSQHFEDPKTKLSPNATKVLCKVMKVITEEACKRAAYEALKNDASAVEVSHFEKILAQLVSNFRGLLSIPYLYINDFF